MTTDAVVGSDMVHVAVPVPRFAANARLRVHRTSVLVVLAYWGRHDAVTPTIAKDRIVTRTDAWYRAASYGRQRVTGTATAWLRIARRPCLDIGALGAARAAAQRAGYHPDRYQRIVVYEPCSAGGIIGVGNVGAPGVVLSQGGMNMPTSVHEQGHNYGLSHANWYECARGASQVTYRADARCQILGYDDVSSAMSLRWSTATAGDFTAPQKYQLGWLAGHVRTVRGSGTFALAPYETSRGTKALRVAGTHGRTYWVEYRTARGNDVHLPAAVRGVLLHVSVGPGEGRSVLLPMVPDGSDVQTTFGSPAHCPACALPIHASWTSPEGIRFTSVSSGASARIAVARGRHAGVPSAVRVVSGSASDQAVRLSFPRAADGGSPVRSYRITASPSGRHVDVPGWTGAATLTATFAGLRNGVAYRFTVAARNDRGVGSGRASAAIVPVVQRPTVQVVSPAENAHVKDIVSITVAAAPNARTRAAVSYVQVLVDDVQVGFVNGARGTVQWDPGADPSVTLGAHTITAIATDAGGRTGRAARHVVLDAVIAPTPTVTSPVAHATVHGLLHVTGTVRFPNRTSFGEVDVYLGNAGGSAFFGTTAKGTVSWSVDLPLDSVPLGAVTMQVSAYDDSGRRSSITVPLTVAHVASTVSVTAPSTANATLAVGAGVHNNSGSTLSYAEVRLSGPNMDPTAAYDYVYFPGDVAPGKDASGTTSIDTSFFVAGTYQVWTVVIDGDGSTVASAKRTVTVAH